MARKKGEHRQRRAAGVSGITVRVLAGSQSCQGPPSPLGPRFRSPQVARPSTHFDSCPTRRLSSDDTMIGCLIISTRFTDRRGSSRVPGRQSFIRQGGARISASAGRTSCSEASPVGYSSSTVFLGREGAFDRRSMGPAWSRRTERLESGRGVPDRVRNRDGRSATEWDGDSHRRWVSSGSGPSPASINEQVPEPADTPSDSRSYSARSAMGKLPIPSSRGSARPLVGAQ